jgi:hypothetical protein
MGTWNTKLNGNDTFQDLYQKFFELYNQGLHPTDISKKIEEEFVALFHDHDDRNNCLFALALAQWETKSLIPDLFQQVKVIVETGNDLDIWEGLGADEKTLEKRKKELFKFLNQISTEKVQAKRRSIPKLVYQANPLLILSSPDGQKTFELIENYVNEEYKDTTSAISWASGGGSVFYFAAKGKRITAKWIDSQTLEIRHDQSIEFVKKDDHFYFHGDQGVIHYIAE